MYCPKCNGLNEDTNVFCVNCGETFLPTGKLPQTMLPAENVSDTIQPTQIFQPPIRQENEFLSTPTVFGGSQNYNQSQANYNQPPPNFNQSQANFNQSQPFINQSQANFNPSFAGFNPVIPQVQPEPKSRLGLWIGLAGLLVLLLGGGIGAAFFFLYKPAGPAEVLPDHLGLFFQNNEKTAVSELKKQDLTNFIEGKDKLSKDDSLPEIESKPNLILYSDGKDIPLTDLKLIQIDSIKSDGKVKQLEFKATPVEGKPEMKRLWFSENLAKGKYAFILIDGFFDDGKHKLWPFQVKNSDQADNANLLKETNIPLKTKSNSSNDNTSTGATTPTPAPTPKPTIAPPVGARMAYANTGNVVVRSAPSLGANKVNGLRRGQRVYILGFSNNYDYWNGLEGNWANVQTESGQRGWVFSPLLSY